MVMASARSATYSATIVYVGLLAVLSLTAVMVVFEVYTQFFAFTLYMSFATLSTLSNFHTHLTGHTLAHPNSRPPQITSSMFCAEYSHSRELRGEWK